MTFAFTHTIAQVTLRVTVVPMGDDLALSVYGGDAPHIGCVALAIPRPSLTGVGQSATVSVLNRTGHKDDVIAVDLAKALAAATGGVVSVSVGVHLDAIDPATRDALAQAGNTLADKVIAHLKAQGGVKEC